jgi:hypothetical protein
VNILFPAKFLIRLFEGGVGGYEWARFFTEPLDYPINALAWDCIRSVVDVTHEPALMITDNMSFHKDSNAFGEAVKLTAHALGYDYCHQPPWQPWCNVLDNNINHRVKDICKVSHRFFCLRGS